MKSCITALVLAFGLLAAETARAEWSWLRSENGHVNEGNKKLAAGDAKGALDEYGKAARELPNEGGVHLDRGLALLEQGDFAAARDALELAAQSQAGGTVRADAHYDLGVAFYKEADAAAGKDDHKQAQDLFREAAGAFKQALRLRPGDKNAAWNYELAARRIREEQEKQKQKEEQEKQEQDQQKQDQQNQDQQNQDQQNQDQQNQDQQNQDQQKQDEQKQDQQKQDQQKQDQQKQDQQKQDQQKQDQQKQDQQKQDQQQQQQQQQAQPQPRPEAERALDALQDGEENLERIKALQRAARERREPEKDW